MANPKRDNHKAAQPAKGRRYTDDQKRAALAQLAANHGNLAKTARETGITRNKLREWTSSEISSSPEITTLKKELAESYRAKLKRAREAGLDRMLELLPEERDLHKVTGAVKVLSELNITEEVADDIGNRPKAGVPATHGAATDQNAPAATLN